MSQNIREYLYHVSVNFENCYVELILLPSRENERMQTQASRWLAFGFDLLYLFLTFSLDKP